VLCGGQKLAAWLVLGAFGVFCGPLPMVVGKKENRFVFDCHSRFSAKTIVAKMAVDDPVFIVD